MDSKQNRYLSDKKTVLKNEKTSGLPEPLGLYNPRHEHDACGIGFVADIKNRKSHDIISDGLKILDNLEHRGAVGADPKAGDGVGILIQTPDAFSAKSAVSQGLIYPKKAAMPSVFYFYLQTLKTEFRLRKLLKRLLLKKVTLFWAGVMYPSITAILASPFFHRNLNPVSF